MTRAAIYTRISQSDPKVEKTADQEKRCRALAAREGYEVVEVYTDDGISAFTGKARPNWIALHDDIAEQRFEVVLAVAEDRLARTSEEKIGFQVHCARHGVRWHTIASGAVDPATAQGALLSTITGAVAQYESHVKRERIQASVARRVAEGKDLGGPRPFGFLADRITPNPAEAPLVVGAYEALLREGSIFAATSFLNASGVRTSTGREWGWSSVKKLLLRARNAGIIEHHGEVVRTDGARLIEPDVLEAARALILNRGSIPRGVKPSALASAVLVCGRCEQPMQNGGAYYRCQTKPGTSAGGRSAREHEMTHPTITRSIADEEVRLRTFLRMVQLSIEEGEGGGGGGEADTGEIAALRAGLAAARERRDRIQQIAMMPGSNLELARTQLEAAQEEIDAATAAVDRAVLADSRESIRSFAKEALSELSPGAGVFVGNLEVAYAEWLPRFRALPVERQRASVSAMWARVRVGLHGRGAKRLEFEPQTTR